MGTVYYAVCHDCKKYRDLDKFGVANRIIRSREEALDSCNMWGNKDFHSVLLATFMMEHTGHNCTMFNEHSSLFDSVVVDEDGGYSEDYDFWKLTKDGY